MTEFDSLSRALDAAEAAGRTVALWWRDDDLETPSHALDWMLETLAPHGIVPALAAVSARVSAEAVTALDGSEAALFPHGWSHANHAPTAEKSTEFGPHRPIEARLTECRDARLRLAVIAGDRALPCFVPPWNRIADDLAGRLHEAGMLALSGFVRLGRPPAGASVPRLDTHIDLIDWRGSRRPIGAEGTAAALCAWIEHRLTGQDDSGVDAPIGFLSHHRVTNRAAWASWNSLLALTAAHPAVCWLTPWAALSAVGTALPDAIELADVAGHGEGMSG